MKNYLFLLLLLLFTNSTIIAQNNTVVKTLNPQKCPNVKIKVPNSLIKQEAWDNSGLRVDILITSDIPKEVLQAIREDINVHLKVVSTSEHKNIDLSTFMFTLEGKEISADKLSFPSLEE